MLDTSVCVELLRGRAPAGRLPPTPECVLSVITVAELEVGIRRSVRPAAQGCASVYRSLRGPGLEAG